MCLFQTETIHMSGLSIHLHSLVHSYLYTSFLDINLGYLKSISNEEELCDKLLNTAYIHSLRL